MDTIGLSNNCKFWQCHNLTRAADCPQSAAAELIGNAAKVAARRRKLRRKLASYEVAGTMNEGNHQEKWDSASSPVRVEGEMPGLRPLRVERNQRRRFNLGTRESKKRNNFLAAMIGFTGGVRPLLPATPCTFVSFLCFVVSTAHSRSNPFWFSADTL
jgi:hypothetical protein